MTTLAQRVQDILLRPQQAWAAIAAEPDDTAAVYRRYVIPMAAIPAVAAFIGTSLIGFGGFGFSVRVPLLDGLVRMVLHYGLSLAMIYVMALIVDALAPSFGGTRNRLQALKLVAYGSTAAFAGGIFSLVPSLAMLGLLASLYSLYLVYLGLPVLMKCPADKAVSYTAVVAVLGLVAGLVVGSVAGLATRGAWTAGYAGHVAASDGGSLRITTPEGKVTVDTAALQAAARQVEIAAQKQAAIATSTAAAVPSVATAAVEGKLGAIPADQLKPFLPEALGDFKRESIQTMGDGQTMPSAATAVYRNQDRSIELNILDVGGGTLGAAATMWAAISLDSDTPTKREKIYREGSRALHEEVDKDGSRAQYQMILANGTMVTADGHQVDAATVKKALAMVDTSRIEALARPAAH